MDDLQRAVCRIGDGYYCRPHDPIRRSWVRRVGLRHGTTQ